MSTTPADLHLLAPDLDAIHAFADLPRHDVPAEARAAAAIYEDVCWRLAFFRLPAPIEKEILAIEEEASRLLGSYLRGALDATTFWPAFGAGVARMDALITGLVAPGNTSHHHQELARLRARVAAAKLSPTVRREVQHLFDQLALAEAALDSGKVETSDFATAFQQAQIAIEDVLTDADSAATNPVDARSHRLAEEVLAASPPAFLRQALLARVEELADAWEQRRPVEPQELAAIENLIERAAQFTAAHGAAAQRYEELRAQIERHHLPEEVAITADDGLASLGLLVTRLEAGQIEADDFVDLFENEAARIETLFIWSSDEIAGLRDAEARFCEARQRLANAHLPRFALQSAQATLVRLGGLLAGLRSRPESQEAFWQPFEAGLAELEASLQLGSALAGEKTQALARFDALCRLAQSEPLSAVLRGPVADQLTTLRELLSQLDAGTLTAAEFHAAFDPVADGVRRLLAWQTALNGGRAEGTTKPPAS